MIEIYLKEFKKKFNIKSSNKNMRATYKLQLTMAKASDIDNMEPSEQIQATLNMTDDVCDYLKNVLKLTDKQVEVLDDLDATETVKLANHVAMRLMGLSEDDIKKASEKKDTDAEKKVSGKE